MVSRITPNQVPDHVIRRRWSSSRGEQQATPSTRSIDATLNSSEELLQGQLELCHHAFGFVKSMALKCAMDLGIPDAILRCGGAATLPDLLATIELHTCNLPYLRRLMRVLTLSHLFALVEGEGELGGDQKEAVYTLTTASRLLVSGGAAPFSQLPCISLIVDRTAVSPFLGMHAWITDKHASTTSLFERANGTSAWELTNSDAAVASMFNRAMAADSALVMHVVLAEFPAVFRGATSLTDVGGAEGAASATIATAFPHLKCTVLDLPHVIAKAAPLAAAAGGNNPLRFVAGDMFHHIPPADIILLKWVLHDWNDEECVRILRECRKATLPSGKVVIIETVVGSRPGDGVCKETQALFDVFMMNVNGAEREEREWKKLFMEAGFADCKITPVLGIRSIVEVYP